MERRVAKRSARGRQETHWSAGSLKKRAVNFWRLRIRLKRSIACSRRQVYRQFGADPARATDTRTVQKFRLKVLRELKKIKLAWPCLNYSTDRGVLILYPSAPVIAPSDHRQLSS